MNKLLLSSIYLFNPLWRSLGVEPRHLYTIVETKLIMDGRRKGAISYASNRAKKEVKGQDVLAMAMFGLLGLLFMFFLFALRYRPSGLFVYFSGYMAFLAMTLISDFTDVLIDVRDNYILLPRPVSSRTVGVSRILHILFYLIKLIIPLAVPAMVFLVIADGVLALLLFVPLMLIATIMTLLLVNLIYLALMNLTTPRRFKEIIHFFQIVFFGISFAGYQLLPRLIGANLGGDINLLDNHWFGFAPSSWLAAIWSWWLLGDTTPYIYVWAVLGLLSPVVSIFLIAQFLSQDFNAKLLAFGEGGGTHQNRAKKVKTDQQKARPSWMTLTGNWICKNTTEKAGYELSWRVTQRSRDFKLKFYPNLVMLLVYFLGIFAVGSGNFRERMEILYEYPMMYLGVLYFSALISMSGNGLTSFSDQFKSAWIYLANPVAQPGYLLSGAYKMIMVRFFIPMYIVLGGLTMAIWGPLIIGDILLAMVNVLLISICSSALNTNNLPFSLPWEEASKGRSFGLAILTMLMSTIIGGLHFLLAFYFPIGVWLMIPLSGLLFFRVLHYYQNFSWRNISLN